MTEYASTLLSRDEIAEQTMAFHFARPADFDFKPGQAIDLVLPASVDTADDANRRHAFSIVSAPFEDELVVATRMRDSVFKRALRSLHVGAQVTIDGPFGSLGLHKDSARAGVLIAGGIGITPFVSMLRTAAQNHQQHRLTLLYSNRRPEDAAFLAELQRLEAQNTHFRLLATMTQMSASSRPWDGLTGPIDSERIQSVLGELPRPIFYVTGPPAMVEAMHQSLAQAGIDDDDVRSESFYGY